MAGRFRAGPRGSGTVAGAPASVAGLDDVEVAGEAVEEPGGHLGDAAGEPLVAVGPGTMADGPSAEGEGVGDVDADAPVGPADKVHRQLVAGPAKGGWPRSSKTTKSKRPR